jgi:hypothetical protein
MPMPICRRDKPQDWIFGRVSRPAAAPASPSDGRSPSGFADPRASQDGRPTVDEGHADRLLERLRAVYGEP